MGKLSLTQFVTIDGVYQAPGGPDEDPSGGFEHGGWSVPYGDEDFGAFMDEVFQRPAAFLLGRRTYDIFAGYWPKQTDPANPVASKLNSSPSTSPPPPSRRPTGPARPSSAATSSRRSQH